MLLLNTGFIGIPVIQALYGDEAIFYAAIVELINDVLIFTVGIMLIQMSAKANLKIEPKQFESPGLIGVIIGLLLFLLNIQLPEVLGGSIEMIGNATTPLTMFCIGFQIGGLKFKEIAGDMQVYAICFVKLLIVPVITLLLVKIWAEIFLLEKVLIIGFAMPEVLSPIFSQQYKGEAVFATKKRLLSTVFSLITIPIFAIIMELYSKMQLCIKRSCILSSSKYIFIYQHCCISLTRSTKAAVLPFIRIIKKSLFIRSIIQSSSPCEALSFDNIFFIIFIILRLTNPIFA